MPPRVPHASVELGNLRKFQCEMCGTSEAVKIYSLRPSAERLQRSLARESIQVPLTSKSSSCDDCPIDPIDASRAELEKK
jgi:hypothetical protein